MDADAIAPKTLKKKPKTSTTPKLATNTTQLRQPMGSSASSSQQPSPVVVGGDGTLKHLPKELISLMYKFPSPDYRECGLCDVKMPRAPDATAHYNGRPHKSAVNRWLLKNNIVVEGWPMKDKPGDDDEAPKAKKPKDMAAGPNFGYCSVCEISLTSTAHSEDHYSGKRHKKNVLKLGKEGLRAD